VSKNHHKKSLVFFLPLSAFVLCLLLQSLNGFAESPLFDKKKPAVPEFYFWDRKLDSVDIASWFVGATIGRIGSETYVGGWAPVGTGRNLTSTLDIPAGYREKYPWLYEFMYREKGTPRFYAINKWAQPVRISFGFPNDLQPYVSSTVEKNSHDLKSKLPEVNLVKGLNETNKREVFDWAEEEILSSIPEMQEVTGLDISFVKSETTDSVDNLGNMRIVLYSGRPEKNGISPIQFRGAMRNAYFRQYLDVLYLQTAVRFTPETVKQVDGYILPNADNTIGMTFCYVWDGHPKDVLQKFIRECLFRSLGMPGEVYLNDASILSFWNDAGKYKKMKKIFEEIKEKEHLKATEPEGFPFAQNPTFFEREEKETRDITDAKSKLLSDKVPVPIKESQKRKLSDFETYLMRLLYSEYIKAGMSEMDVYWRIVENVP